LPIVLNEWVFHDLRGDNGVPRQLEAAEFLTSFVHTTEQIAVARPSPWTRKAFQLMTISAPPVRIFSQILHLAILQDPLRCQYLEADSLVPVPQDLAEVVPNDDIYLFRTALTANAGKIVTSDERLIATAGTAALANGISLELRDDFLANHRGALP